MKNIVTFFPYYEEKRINDEMMGREAAAGGIGGGGGGDAAIYLINKTEAGLESGTNRIIVYTIRPQNVFFEGVE